MWIINYECYKIKYLYDCAKTFQHVQNFVKLKAKFHFSLNQFIKNLKNLIYNKCSHEIKKDYVFVILTTKTSTISLICLCLNRRF